MIYTKGSTRKITTNLLTYSRQNAKLRPKLLLPSNLELESKLFKTNKTQLCLFTCTNPNFYNCATKANYRTGLDAVFTAVLTDCLHW